MNKFFIDSTRVEQWSALHGGTVAATYEINASSQEEAEKKAVQIATGQTLGYAPENPEDFEGFIAKVKQVTWEKSQNKALIEVLFPRSLFGSDVAGLVTVIFGKVSFASSIKLTAVEADERFLRGLSKAKFGLSGLRERCLKLNSQRPPLMAILKPGIGRDVSKLAKNFHDLAASGVQLIKDDEVCIDLDDQQALRRLDAVQKTGLTDKCLYVQALNGPAFSLKKRAITLIGQGSRAFLVCPYTYGLSVFQDLCLDPEISVPIFAHPAFTGPMSFGVRYSVVLGSLLRLCGADAVLYPSPYGSIALEKAEALTLHQKLVAPSVLPAVASVPSAGIVPDFVKLIKEDFGSDVIVNAGTGMSQHPKGISVGVSEFLKAIELHY